MTPIARLFAKTIKSRGVTQHSILNRLLESGAVRIDQEQQTVELVKPTYLPVHSDDQLGAFEMGYAAAANLMETIVHNFETEDGEEKLFQRGVWAHRIPLQKRQELRRAVSEVLGGVEDQGREVLRQFEENVESPTQFTAGISLFYFEDDLDRHQA